ncbi:MAG: hypothetical protein NNA21_05010 [Nitrospira sp.]|nr:hypothetical protein [Nitrospira sp.]MCP9462413.1 hypothetical protein [Nitrospira sp.]MCP9475243.1 hypothetical protein [Nitrospira sp.]
MKKSIACVVAITVALLVTACVHRPSAHLSGTNEPPIEDRSLLAGEWEYEDGAVVTLRLDKRGNGTYPYKDGRFETLRLNGHTWVGKWYQKENDREGGFRVVLSDDYTEGDGTWWYDRIGEDSAPAQKGGTFHLSKRTSLTRLDETPPAP